MKELSLQELQGVAKEMHDMEDGFDIDYKEKDFDTLLTSVQNTAGELADTDECNLSDEAKAALHGLGIKLPWDEEEIEELEQPADEEDEEEVADKEDQPEEEEDEKPEEIEEEAESEVEEAEIVEPVASKPEPKSKTKKEKVVVKKKIKDNGPAIVSKSEKEIVRESMKEVEAAATAKKAKAVAKPVAKKVAKVKAEPKAKSRYGHREGTTAATMDDMLWKGTTLEAAVKVLVKDFGKSEQTAKSAFKSHIAYLPKIKNIPIVLKGETYKAGKASL